MSWPGRDRADRRHVRIGLVVTFALLAAGLTVSIGWVVGRLVERSLARTDRAELAARLQGIDLEIAQLGTSVSETLERLVPDWVAYEPQRLARLLAGGAAAVDEAARLTAITKLDFLTALDERGTVLSSSHWPELAGLAEPSLSDCPVNDGIVRRIKGPEGSRLAVVFGRPLAIDERRLVLIGGRWLDARLATAVGRGKPAGVFDLEPGGSEPFLSSGASKEFVEGAWELARVGRTQAAIVAGAADASLRSWLIGRYPLRDDRGELLGAVVIGVPRTLPGLAGRLRKVFVLTGGVAVALAALAGLWMATRISRPVDRLVRAVDAIAAGEADYSFPSDAGHELDRLAQAFSRLQRSLEQQQRRSAAAERVAAWQEAARRVAHEVKNPLAPIRLTVENLKRARARDPRLFDELFEEGTRTILDEVEQLQRLVTEFSEFARLPAPRLRPVDLHDLIDGVLDLHAVVPGLEIVRSYGSRSVIVDADAEQVGRVLKNVVGNAVEAMPAGTQPRRLEVQTELDGDRVEIQVCDSGAGLTPEALRKLFKPYFTTKPDGTGLGMAIAYGIISEHGGEIDADNRAAGGARIRIRLPTMAAREAQNGAKT